MERIVEIKHDELKELLIEFNKIEKFRQEQIDIVKEAEDKHNGLMVDRQKLVDKMKQLVDEEKLELGKYETVTNIDLETDESEVVQVKVIDRLKMAQDTLDKEIDKEAGIITEEVEK